MNKKITIFGLLLVGMHSFSQIINTAPYILTVNELKQWTTSGVTASTNLISTVNLAPRFTNSATQFNPALSDDMKIAYLPDGMNNFGNYYGEQSQFNLYNFTHWAYIDKLVWFGGTASQTIQLPSSPWVNAAHKNGVKVFGNVFFAPTAFGGSTATLTNFLEQDINGNFVAIPKMIAMMQYYNFDGWFINQETATNAATAVLMHDFVRDLTAQAEALGKEIMWYDAMRLSGAVGWQNRLTANNSPFVQDDQDSNGSFETRVSSNIFINFGWGSSAFPLSSRTRADLIGRSSFDVFTGVDIWPGRNQGNFETNGNTFMTNLHENATTPVTSLGIFAPNCVYNNSTYTNFNNDPTDFTSFYNAENHLFSGDDNNPATVDATGFKGLANWLPEVSVINSIPFETDFCTGHGTKKFNLGTQTSSDSWHDMNKQAILPTWQWAFSENNVLAANWDFTDALSNGNSIKIAGNLTANHAIDLMLYKTKLQITEGVYTFNLFYKCTDVNDTKMKLLVVFSDNIAQKYEFPVIGGFGLGNNWTYGEIALPLEYSGREMAMVGLRFDSATAVSDYVMNVGGINIGNVVLGLADQIKNNSFVTISYPVQGNALILFNLNWPYAKQLQYSVTDMQGKIVKENTISLDASINFPFQTNGMAAGTYIVKFTDQSNHSEIRKLIVK
ncbi:T9SS type A sorting domain-containing protein [Flavobacterium sp.]|uniref:endo-beta-N-acetylglucosaminidase n=1 Tax=Flavobacterium sp. TaxID=239 RepID=UPI002616B7D8|nr:T9SS type A sorting domain-containing protein [Flavobacterium sp.]